jgi:hypothetical protein
MKREQSFFVRQLGTRQPTVWEHAPIAIVRNEDGAFARTSSFEVGNPLILGLYHRAIHKKLLSRFKA